MRKGILLLIIVFCMTMAANAQQEITALNLTIQNPKDVYTVAQADKGLAFLFKTNKQYQTTILTDDFKEQRKTVYKRNTADKKEELLGGFIDSIYAVFYFHHPKSNILSQLKVNRVTGEQLHEKFFVLQPKEQVLKGFQMDNKFYILTVMQYKNDLTVYTISPHLASIQADMYNVEFPTFYGRISRKSDGTEEEKPVAIDAINPDAVYSIRTSHSDKKLYYQHGKIFLTFDDPDRTHLIEIDTEKKSSVYKKLNFTLERTSNISRQQGNSFIKDNTLYRVSMNPDQMNLSVLNLDTMNLLATYNVFPEENEVSIANSPIIQQGIIVGFDNNDEKIIRKTTQFFKKALGGEIAIVVNKMESDKLAIQIGSYEEFTVYRGAGTGIPLNSGSSYSPYSTASLGYGYPGFGYASYFPNSGSSMTRINLVHFESLFESTHKHVEGNVPKSAMQRVSDFKEEKFGPAWPEVNATFTYKQNIILGFLNKRTNKFQLLGFKK